MTVIGVLPREERAAVGRGVLDVEETTGEAGVVLQGLEPRLRERVVIGDWGAAHFERFVRGTSKPSPLPEEVWINPPATLKTGGLAHSIAKPGVSKSLAGSAAPHEGVRRSDLRDRESRDGIPSLRPARGLEGARRMGSGVCGLQPETDQRAAGGHRMSQALVRLERTGSKSSSRGKYPVRPACGQPARANLGSGS